MLRKTTRRLKNRGRRNDRATTKRSMRPSGRTRSERRSRGSSRRRTNRINSRRTRRSKRTRPRSKGHKIKMLLKIITIKLRMERVCSSNHLWAKSILLWLTSSAWIIWWEETQPCFPRSSSTESWPIKTWNSQKYSRISQDSLIWLQSLKQKLNSGGTALWKKQKRKDKLTRLNSNWSSSKWGNRKRDRTRRGRNRQLRQRPGEFRSKGRHRKSRDNNSSSSSKKRSKTKRKPGCRFNVNSKLRNSRQFNNRKDQLSLQFKSRKLSKKLNQNKISELLNNKFKQHFKTEWFLMLVQSNFCNNKKQFF